MPHVNPLLLMLFVVAPLFTGTHTRIQIIGAEIKAMNASLGNLKVSESLHPYIALVRSYFLLNVLLNCFGHAQETLAFGNGNHRVRNPREVISGRKMV